MSWWRKNTVANFCWCIRKCYFSFLFCPRILVRCACMWTSIQDNKWCKWYALVWLCNDDSNNVTEFITKKTPAWKREKDSKRARAWQKERNKRIYTWRSWHFPFKLTLFFSCDSKKAFSLTTDSIIGQRTRRAYTQLWCMTQWSRHTFFFYLLMDTQINIVQSNPDLLCCMSI